MILAADVGLFVGDDIHHILLIYAIRQVDSGPENAQHEGGGDPFALINVTAQTYRIQNTPSKLPVTDEGVAEHYSDACQPEKAPVHGDSLNPVYRLRQGHGYRFRKNGIGNDIQPGRL